MIPPKISQHRPKSLTDAKLRDKNDVVETAIRCIRLSLSDSRRPSGFPKRKDSELGRQHLNERMDQSLSPEEMISQVNMLID